MTSAILDDPKVRYAKKQTSEANNAVKQWSAEKERITKDTDKILALAMTLVAAWKAVAEFVDQSAQNDEIDDYRALGDTLLPFVTVSKQILAAVDGCRLQAESLQCEIENGTDFKIAVYEMDRVFQYFDNWPRSRSDLTEKIREEFARGEFRDLEDFLNEMQTSDHTPR